jgi:hypothetical protein
MGEMGFTVPFGSMNLVQRSTTVSGAPWLQDEVKAVRKVSNHHCEKYFKVTVERGK